jgi:DNA polymerase-3 subunit epsilon
MRQIVLDTETTGLEPEDGHRVIEIGCVEVVERRLTGNNFHQYLQPDREIDEGAVEVHGITNELLADKPRFEDVAQDFVRYIRGAELIIHNAPFDVGFLNAELARLPSSPGDIDSLCPVTDTLVMARRMHPGQRNSLDALCKRYRIDNSNRDLHGALLDAELLADVYLAMTGGQVSLALGGLEDRRVLETVAAVRPLPADRAPTRVIRADEEELVAHARCLAGIDQASGGKCLWRTLGD